MKRLLAVGLGAAMLFAGAVALSQDAKTPGASGKVATAPSSMPTMAQMDEHMKKMQALHEKMMGAATPEERQKAMEDARQEMQESMAMMEPMMQGGGMMSGGMMGGGMMGGKGKSGDAQAQRQMMLDPQDMMGAPKAPESVPKT
jgi:hypothetical protein